MNLVAQLDQLFQTTDNSGIKSDFYVKPTMRNGKSYIKIISDFINKIKCTHSLSRDAILGRVDVVDLYSPIPYKTGLKTLRQTLGKRNSQNILTENIVKITGFVVKNCFQDQPANIRQNYRYHVFPTYACTCRYGFENKFLYTYTHIFGVIQWHC